MSVRETFDNIEEGDIVRFAYDACSHDYTVESIHGTGNEKSIWFGLDLEGLELVIINNKVSYKKRARAHPPGWTVNGVIKELEIINKNNNEETNS